MIGYQVEVKGLRQSKNSRDVVQFDVDGFNTDLKQATINEGLGIIILSD